MEAELQQVQEIYTQVTGFLVNQSFEIIGSVIFQVLQTNNIAIPFPQREIRIMQQP